MTTLDYQKKIISLLSEVDRSGLDNLIKFIRDSNYLTTAKCHFPRKGPFQILLQIGDCKSTGTNKIGSTYRFACL